MLRVIPTTLTALLLMSCTASVPPARGAVVMPASLEAAELSSQASRQLIDAGILEAIWQASQSLAPGKQVRLKPSFSHVIALLAEGPDRRGWMERIGLTEADLQRALHEGSDYALGKSRTVLAEAGQSGFIQQARLRSDAFNIGRPEMLTAMALDTGDEAFSHQLVELMRTLAQTDASAAGYERADLAHGLTQIAMRKCDLALFDYALPMTGGPESIRYALWRARITGSAGLLAERIRTETADGDGDTRPVRQALEGYEAILEFGYCS